LENTLKDSNFDHSSMGRKTSFISSPERMEKSTYLSENGSLLDIAWNDTSPRNPPEPRELWEWDDATWILAASFIIFTMQTGRTRA